MNTSTPFQFKPFHKENYQYLSDVNALKDAIRRQLGSNYRPLPFNDPKLFRGHFNSQSFKLRRRKIARVPWEAVAIIEFCETPNNSIITIKFRTNYFFTLLELLLFIAVVFTIQSTTLSIVATISISISLFLVLYGMNLWGFWYQVKKLKLELERFILA